MRKHICPSGALVESLADAICIWKQLVKDTPSACRETVVLHAGRTRHEGWSLNWEGLWVVNV